MSVMMRDPVQIPRKPGVFLLASKSSRCGYVAYTSDLQKRSHSLSHMLQNPKTHWSIKDLPRLPAKEFTFTVIAADVDTQKAEKIIKLTKQSLKDKRYKVINGSRGATAMVTFGGESMALTEAIKKAKCKTAYITVWRRIARGWTIEQALGVDPAPIRWNPADVKAQRKRAEQRAAA